MLYKYTVYLCRRIVVKCFLWNPLNYPELRWLFLNSCVSYPDWFLIIVVTGSSHDSRHQLVAAHTQWKPFYIQICFIALKHCEVLKQVEEEMPKKEKK